MPLMEAGMAAAESGYWWRVLQAQLLAVMLATLLTWVLAVAGLPGEWLSWVGAGLYILSACMAARLRALPLWWYPILALDLPLLLWLVMLAFPPIYYLLVFALLWLVYKDNQRERVPLYLTGASAITVLDFWLYERRPATFVDLGCGLGGLLCRLARKHPDIRFTGIESAPLPWLIARWRSRGLSNCVIHYGNFWRHDLAGFDFVYAYLSPQPMARLWRKACHDMRPGTALVSYHFIIPDVHPDFVQLDEAGRAPLYLWSIAPQSDPDLSMDG